MKKVSCIGVIVVLLLCVSLFSGCQEKPPTPSPGPSDDGSSPFIGTWKSTDSSPDFDTWSFYANGSVENYNIQNLDGENVTSISWYQYNETNDTVCMMSQGNTPGSPDYFSECYTYVFSENSTRLTLSFHGTIFMVLAKQ